MTQQERRGDWFVTYSGRQFWPFDARVEEIFIDDIAHSLSLQTRWNGHCTRFYSIAEHSIACAETAYRQYSIMSRSEDIRAIWRWCLLHDAAEAYLGDIIRPIKRFLFITGQHGEEPLRAFENHILKLIAERFGLPWPMPEAVHEIDNRMLVTEARALTRFIVEDEHWVNQKSWAHIQGYEDLELRERSMEQTRDHFLELFHRYFPRHV